ncbi:hypothetical protein L2D14_12450 [Thalassospiraceae bacterium LMO-JJ14]|nr:hypothetical protein L2D14_12450 [Thalassospiraceae bacterium LMO-JJ14]
MSEIDDQSEDPAEDIDAVFGDDPQLANETYLTELVQKKREFAPWHHPVKQIVRIEQWASLANRLIRDRDFNSPLRYFTLPGPDLLDVRVLAEVCAKKGISIDYFGFNSSIATVPGQSGHVESDRIFMAESAIRQSGVSTPTAYIMPDRLEDIANQESHAFAKLQQQQPFDIVNIDACNHLAFRSEGRQHSIFDALNSLLRHQMPAKAPWLLFITTRAEPALLDDTAVEFDRAIAENLRISADNFGQALAEAIGAPRNNIGAALKAVWTRNDIEFLKIFTIGLSKYLLQYFHTQPNLRAGVELASAYCYRVYGPAPDMAALAFRITPGGVQAIQPMASGAVVIPDLEEQQAIRVVQKAAKIRNIDESLESDEGLRKSAVDGTKILLGGSNYDLDAWEIWVTEHSERPIRIKA